MSENTLEIAKRFIEHAPPATGPGNPELSGFNGKGVDICNDCAGRIIARGCDLKTVADVPVWKPETVDCDLCYADQAADELTRNRENSK